MSSNSDLEELAALVIGSLEKMTRIRFHGHAHLEVDSGEKDQSRELQAERKSH